jgi:Ca2+-binding RTX toxin-like protein
MTRTWRGTAGNDDITGPYHDDNVFINFGKGFDTLTGGARSDTFFLTVDETRDIVEGLDGIDTVDYSGADRGLTIDLQNGVTIAKFYYEAVQTPGGGYISRIEDKIVTDLRHIENVVGSNHDDVIVGNDGRNVIEGGGGADTIYGGGGSDTVSYAHSSEGVRVVLRSDDLETAGYGVGGDATGDRLISIENVIGSQHNDVLYGGRGDNVLTGGNGSDTFVFNRWSGNDTVTDFKAGGSNHDILEFAEVFKDFNDLLAHAENNGHDVVIHIDGQNSVTLLNAHVGDLHQSDFSFV